MISQKAKLLKSAFNAAILTTFGKIDQQDIDKIDGSAERLVTQLIEQYGWIAAEAQSRVDELCASVSTASAYCKTDPKDPKQQVGS